MLGFEPMVMMLQELETLLDLVRKGDIPFSDHAGDLTLLLMDKARDFIEQFKQNSRVNYDKQMFDDVGAGLKKLPNANKENIVEELSTLGDDITVNITFGTENVPMVID